MRKLLFLLFWAAVVGMSQPAAAQTTEPPAAWYEPGRAKGSIAVPAFKRLLAERPTAVHLIDVSSAREFGPGSIKGAINIPINQFEKQIATLPNDKPIIFFCTTGGRASEAHDTAVLLRPELTVYFLDAQVQMQPDGTPSIK